MVDVQEWPAIKLVIANLSAFQEDWKIAAHSFNYSTPHKKTKGRGFSKRIIASCQYRTQGSKVSAPK